MGRYRRRRRSTWRRPLLLVVVVLALGGTGWWFYPRGENGEEAGKLLVGGPNPSLTRRLPLREAQDPPADAQLPVVNTADPAMATNPVPAPNLDALVASGRQALQKGDLVAARTSYNDALAKGLNEPDASVVREELSRIGAETILSSRILPDDPLTDRYIIQPGDTLGKIAKRNQVPVEMIAEINGIRNINRIRAGQTIKTVQGPFNVVLHKSTYRMDVYLGTTFVRYFSVGLGLDGSTPTGQWRVSVKLKNPTYYPPRGGQIVSADDPKNPLGERWIGLEGVSGEAIGQMRYGIHGTIEPESIGKSMSMGCIRMHNRDVETLYDYLIEGKSTITVLD